MLGFRADPSVDLGLLALVLAYARLARTAGTFRRPRGVWFVAGVATVWVALESPLDPLGDGYLQSAHMVQHMLLMTVAAPLLLLGLTPPMAAWVFRLRGVRHLTHPVFAQCAAALVVVAWHLPGPYDVALGNDAVHIVEHLSFLVAGVLYWAPLVDATSAHATTPLSQPQRLVYMLAGAFPMMGVALALQFSHELFYPAYAHVPRILPGISPLTDQIIAGAVMMVMDMGSNGIGW
ncbi:MAG: cytochrome c oxidase assembly protein, partial [Candidatus Dormibacteraceae bacterium]